eukprot:TRINITY_DN1826_c0_g1_i1.p1 TRINITY_DN1826_c0_g1~~TRINITY_DN1826_c0_g1_i1.p1  ORF type:complete len:242 (+),score=25.49 TRINITY_DN1826_c0_g1_i1:60-785(+)
MIRRPPRSTLSSSSAASDVYKRQISYQESENIEEISQSCLSFKLKKGIVQIKSKLSRQSEQLVEISSEQSIKSNKILIWWLDIVRQQNFRPSGNLNQKVIACEALTSGSVGNKFRFYFFNSINSNFSFYFFSSSQCLASIAFNYQSYSYSFYYFFKASNSIAFFNSYSYLSRNFLSYQIFKSQQGSLYGYQQEQSSSKFHETVQTAVKLGLISYFACFLIFSYSANSKKKLFAIYFKHSRQ